MLGTTDRLDRLHATPNMEMPVKHEYPPGPAPCTGGARNPEASSRKALLLRVGMDRGTGGALGPIFRDGTFEYIPIPEAVPTRSPLTYATLPGRHVPSLATVLPERLAERHPHIDPDFATVTYGDAAPRKRRQLLRLMSDDILVFYAGLSPRPPEDRPRLFAIGGLHVRKVHHLRSGDLGRCDLQRKFGQTAHFLRRTQDEELALVEGEPRKAGLFARALPLADANDGLLRDLAAWGYQGSLLRSVGHWINEPQGLRCLEAWLLRGPVSLVGPDTRLVRVAASALRASPNGGDLSIVNQKVREGDWIVAFSEDGPASVVACGRVNRTLRKQGGRAFSSLFWFFAHGRPALQASAIPALTLGQTIADAAVIRRLVSWFHRHYRIGTHLQTTSEQAHSRSQRSVGATAQRSRKPRGSAGRYSSIASSM